MGIFNRGFFEKRMITTEAGNKRFLASPMLFGTTFLLGLHELATGLVSEKLPAPRAQTHRVLSLPRGSSSATFLTNNLYQKELTQSFFVSNCLPSRHDRDLAPPSRDTWHAKTAGAAATTSHAEARGGEHNKALCDAGRGGPQLQSHNGRHRRQHEPGRWGFGSGII